jgi:hypothetical protein
MSDYTSNSVSDSVGPTSSLGKNLNNEKNTNDGLWAMSVGHRMRAKMPTQSSTDKIDNSCDYQAVE